MGLPAEKMRRATYADLEAAPANKVAEEVFTLGADGKWGEPVIHRDAEVVRAEPFDAIELELPALWA